VTKIIDAMTSIDNEARNGRQIEQNKGMLDLNTSHAILAQINLDTID